MRWFRVFRRSLLRRLVDVKYMMYQTDEPEEKKKKKRKSNYDEEGGGVENDWEIAEEGERTGEGDLKHSTRPRAIQRRIITTPFVFCFRDKSLVDNVSMKKSRFYLPSFSRIFHRTPALSFSSSDVRSIPRSFVWNRRK